MQKLSLIDYPGKVAAVIFTQGCDFRCPFCHNAELVLPERFSGLTEEETVFSFLKKRQGQLQGVVVTGGEPTIQKDLGVFLRQVKALGFFVKLDTNGNHPDVLQSLIDQKLVDYVAMDVKASLAKYSEVAGVSVDTDKIQRSIRLILDSGLDYQFRTTVLKTFLSESDLRDIVSLISGTKSYFLQKFTYQKGVLQDTLLDRSDYTAQEFEAISKKYAHSA